MPSIDLISSSFILAWSESAFTPLCPANRIYLGRPQQPAALGAGFPYMALTIKEVGHEVVTKVDDFNSLVTYLVTVDIWTCQGMTGGTSSGDQVTDQGNLQRATGAILNRLPPNTPWNYVEGFLHSINDGNATIDKDQDLYIGGDVLKSSQTWRMLVSE